MTRYELYSLFIDCFTAVGTCGASALALYFWYNDKKVKIRFHAMHADGYGQIESIDGGYFVVKITNLNAWPISIETAGLKGFSKKYFIRKIIAYNQFENNLIDRLPDPESVHLTVSA
jgi:hypothetical protein